MLGATPSPWRRAARGSGAALGALLVFAFALPCAVLLHAGAPAMKRLVSAEINRALEGKLRGRLEIRTIRRVGLDGVDDVSAAVHDPEGRVVSTVDGASVRVWLPSLVWTALHGRGLLTVRLRDVRVRSLDVTLVPGPDGQPTLVHAVEPSPTTPQAPPRPVRLDVTAFRLENARVHGRLGPFADFAAHLSAVDASFAHDERLTVGHVSQADATVTGLAPQPIRAAVRADFAIPSPGTAHARADVDARVGELPLTATATLTGSRVDAQATASATRDALEALAPALVPLAPASARAEVHGTLSAAHATAGVLAAVGTLDATADLHRRGPAKRVTFDAHAALGDLARVPGLDRPGTRGSAVLDGRGWVDLPSAALQGDLDLHVRNARLENQDIGQAVAHARVEGTLSAPRGRLTAVAEGLRLAGRPLDRVDLEAEGPVREPEVSAVAVGPDLPRIEARASVRLGSAIDVESPVVLLSRNDERLVAVADRIRAAGGDVDVTGIEVRGAGEPLRGEVHLRPHTVRLRLSTPGMDLTPLLHVAGASPMAHGNLWLDVDLRADPGGAFGRASARVEADGVLGEQPGRARLHLGFDGRRVDGNAGFTTGDANASVTLTRVTLAGSPLEERSWRRATGVVDLDADVPLATLSDLLPAGVAPFEGVGGAVALQARVSRREPGTLPDVTLDATTTDLSLVGRSTTPWRLDGADVSLTAAMEGTRDRVTVDGEIDDDDGALARFAVDARPALEEFMRTPARFAPLLERMPVHALLEVPERDLATWPAAFRPPVLRGRVQAQAELTGALVDPRVRMHARAQSVQTTLSRTAVPFDGSLEATYDGHAVIARAIASDARKGGGVVLDARSDLDVRVADLLEHPAGGVPWDASATVALHEFPLQGVPQVSDAGVGGLATGVVAIEGLHRDARLDADLTLYRLHLAAACFDDGWLHLRADGRTLAGAVGLGRPGASAALWLRAASRWGASLTPAIDTSHAIDASLDATNFRAGALLPLLRGSLNQLDGRIDADARIRVEPNFARGSMDGEIRLTGGVLELPAIGERLHDVTATVSMRPWGTLRFDDITARGPTGRLTASAQAVLDGLHLRSASAEVDIPNEQRMPLTVEGVSLGEASGHLRAEATMSPDRRVLDVAVQVARLDMRLPQSSQHAVQSLDPAPHVVVGAYEPDGRFVELPMHARQKPRPPGSTEIRIAVDLGDNATLRRDANLDVQLTGTPTAVVDEVPRVDGAVRVVRGWVDFFGKRFTLDPASTIAFTGDPDNPQLVVTASYDSPDGTHIFADVLGPAKNPKIALRSDPPRPQDAIVGLLLFGSEEGPAGTPAPAQQPDPTQRAAGLAAGPVTDAINKALSGITALDLSTRIDTSQAANPRPELDVRVSNEVVARVTVQTGMPAPGELPDRTMLTVDWRFHPRWSLESTVGDEGSTLIDVLWRHRY